MALTERYPDRLLLAARADGNGAHISDPAVQVILRMTEVIGVMSVGRIDSPIQLREEPRGYKPRQARPILHERLVLVTEFIQKYQR